MLYLPKKGRRKELWTATQPTWSGASASFLFARRQKSLQQKALELETLRRMEDETEECWHAADNSSTTSTVKPSSSPTAWSKRAAEEPTVFVYDTEEGATIACDVLRSELDHVQVQRMRTWRPRHRVDRLRGLHGSDSQLLGVRLRLRLG